MKTMTIWKYSLAVTDQQVLSLPKGAGLLRKVHPGAHPYELWVWAIVDPDEEEKEDFTFRIYGTGNPMSVDLPNMTYVDTAITPRGMVWHVFVEDDEIELLREEMLRGIAAQEWAVSER